MQSIQTPAEAARAVIDKMGGTAAFARTLGYDRQRVHHWRNHGIPFEQLPTVHRATGFALHVLRPDLLSSVG